MHGMLRRTSRLNAPACFLAAEEARPPRFRAAALPRTPIVAHVPCVATSTKQQQACRLQLATGSERTQIERLRCLCWKQEERVGILSGTPQRRSAPACSEPMCSTTSTTSSLIGSHAYHSLVHTALRCAALRCAALHCTAALPCESVWVNESNPEGSTQGERSGAEERAGRRDGIRWQSSV